MREIQTKRCQPLNLQTLSHDEYSNSDAVVISGMANQGRGCFGRITTRWKVTLKRPFIAVRGLMTVQVTSGFSRVITTSIRAFMWSFTSMSFDMVNQTLTGFGGVIARFVIAFERSFAIVNGSMHPQQLSRLSRV